MRNLILYLFLSITLISCRQEMPANGIICVKDGQFIKGGRPYYFIGANFWYGVILASEGTGGDTIRLCKELDMLKSIGVDNLRVLVGADGEDGVEHKVEPALQVSPGVYNDTLLRGLDRLLYELGKRDMNAVLYLNNSWDWSGGYSQYLKWTGHKNVVDSNIDSWENYCAFVTQFHESDSCKAIFARYVKEIVSRRNTITGMPYKDDPAIFSWQVSNEPRAFSDRNKEPFATWIGDVARLIKSIDPNHMVSTGSEGKFGCQSDMALFEKIHSYPQIDYLNIHIWPYNWQWITKESVTERLDSAVKHTKEYLEEHMAVAKKLDKPLVIEEFGYPREGFLFTPGSSVASRDLYYDFVMGLVTESAGKGGLLAGCNFWAWGGFAAPNRDNSFWVKGDDYCGDPAQEPQGLNSVFFKDSSTLNIIRQKSRRQR